MSLFGRKPELDPLLRPYADAQTDQQASACFDRLWSQTLQREAKCVLLPNEHNAEELSYLVGDTGIRLSRALAARRQRAAWNLSNVRAYTRRIARNVFVDHVRAKRPGWRRLQQRVRASIQSDGALDAWGPSKSLMCGLRAWGQQSRPMRAQAEIFLDENYDTFCRDCLHNQSPAEVVGKDQSGLPSLIRRILEWVDTPLPVSALVYHLAKLLCIDDAQPVAMDAVENADERLCREEDDPMNDLLDRLDKEERLVLFGRFLCEAMLQRRERGAVSLNLEQTDILDSLQVKIGELANALGFPCTERAAFSFFIEKVWGEIPLTDDETAEVLDVKPTLTTSRRQLVANSRKDVRTRKWPVWLREHGATRLARLQQDSRTNPGE